MLRFSLSATALAFVLAACDPATSTPPPSAACPAPANGPTIHRGPIEASETWTADTGPHIVPQTISVRAGATLNIEPCSVVQVDPGAGFDVAFPGTPTTGSLLAIGTAEKTIRFEGKSGAAWNGIRVDTGATVRLANVTIENAGAIGAAIIVSGDGTRPVHKNLFVDHVTIKSSKGAGVRLERDAAFIDGSDALTITDSASFPLETDEHGIGSLPRGTYTGNADDRVFIDPTGPLTESATMKELGLPYLVGNFPGDSLVIGEALEKPLATLTVEAGVRVEFFPGTAFEIEHSTGDKAASGALVAVGTALAPIVFTSSKDAPAKGDWQGLWFGGIPNAANSIQHARIEYTGADCGCILSTCSAIDRSEGAVIFTAQPARAFIEDTVVAHADSHAVVLGYEGDVVDFQPGITTEDVAGCEQTRPSAPICESPRPACM